MIEGKIVKQISNDYTVKVDNKSYICKARGKFRNMGITPLVGDNALIDCNTKCIIEIKSRKNELIRPSIANVDQAVIVMSNKIPEFSLDLLDKLLCIIEYNNIKPIIYVSKTDLLNEFEINNLFKILDYYKKIGYQVYTDMSIKEVFKDKVTVFVGQSGAGKSTLLNNLDSNLELLTGEVSVALGRGKHTTRHVELLEVLDGLIADTPKYKDCMHNLEDDCRIKNEINNNILKSRYDNYIKFISEVER